MLITTYNDVKNNREFSFEKFNVIICDGIHYLDSEMIEKGLENKKMCLIGFTSQVDGAVDGYFEDAKCVFRYTLQDALNAGYSVKGREFDAIVWEILKKQGYEMKMPEHLDAAYDMRADKGEKHFIIEVKTWFQETVSDSVLRKTVEQLLYAAQKENGVPMLVIAYPYPEEIKERLSTNEKIKIIGVIELLDMTQDDSELENRLRASLNYSLNKLQCKRQTTRLV